MGSSSMKAYLAEKYMSGPKADAILAHSTTKKKKKRKTAPVEVGMVKDEDGGWGDVAAMNEEEELKDAVVAADRGFKKRKVESGQGWTTVEEGAMEEDVVVGGLVSGAQLKHMTKKKEVENEETAEEIARQQETVYRDASGRRIDTKAARAEAARKKREKEEAEAKKMEWGKGLVQRDEEDRRREELEKAKNRPFARRVDDKEMNEELKERQLWNDPAAAFLTKKKKGGLRKPEYSGPPPPPNRFGVKPGYRWDGVDRSNGFEKKFFQSRNANKRLTAESYAWGVEDM
ncbi:hypothetical protein L218DRAFT_854860 [Marasmius fiardii PR-910]|nr:hypothetical protein L218DRAFT_854860 [Marasmius fiardii PR-910]